MSYTPAYIQDLQRQARDEKTVKPSNLRQRLLDWHSSLPAVSRDRPFAMSEIETALKKPGRIVSAVLAEAGWRRKRKWSGEHYNRYWMPPPD